MENVKIQCNYKKYNIFIENNIYNKIIKINDYKRLINRIRYFIKNNEMENKKDKVFYSMHYISNKNDSFSYSVLYNTTKSCFEVFNID